MRSLSLRSVRRSALLNFLSKTGAFPLRFGSNDLNHQRGVCIDYKGRVIILECQVMAVTIYTMEGVRLHRFLVDNVKFSSAICVKDRHEIFSEVMGG
jgi:hypothetical protein